jgi:arylsulfatase A-like enzyme
VSFAPLITGKPTKQSGSTRVGFTELADESFVSLVTTEWKLIRNDANGDLQLYHISQDDRELRNLVDDQPQTARDINARLQEMMKYAGVSK